MEYLVTPALYEIYSVAFPAPMDAPQVGTVMIDAGSDTDYIRHDFAAALGLQGTPYTLNLKVVDMDYRPMKTAKYDLVIRDRHGDSHEITAIGLETITTLPQEPCLDPLNLLLPDLDPGVWERSGWQIDVLLGLRTT